MGSGRRKRGRENNESVVRRGIEFANSVVAREVFIAIADTFEPLAVMRARLYGSTSNSNRAGLGFPLD